MAVPPSPSGFWVRGTRKLGEVQNVTFDCGSGDTLAETVHISLSQTDGGTPVWSAVLDGPAWLSTWYTEFPTDSLTSSPCYLTAYGVNSSGTGPSATVGVNLFTAPTVAVTAPANGATLTSASVTMAWTVSDDTGSGISDQSVTIAHGSDIIFSASVGYKSRSYEVPSSVVFEDGESYTFTVTASNFKAMDGSASSTVSFDFPSPAAATLTMVPGAGMSATVRVEFGTGSPATASVDVLRVDAVDNVHTIATGLADGATCTDPLPPLGADYQYIAVSRSAAGGVCRAAYTFSFQTTFWVLNYGGGASEHIVLRYNPQAGYAMKHGGDLYHLADGGEGGGLPVFYPTTDAAHALRDASLMHPVMWLRDPFGQRWRARVTVSYSHGVGQRWRVVLAWDAVRFEEA